MNTAQWRCTQCGDVMPAKYRQTHPILCAFATALITPRVEQAIEQIRDYPPDRPNG